jgi:hypothetical protein
MTILARHQLAVERPQKAVDAARIGAEIRRAFARPGVEVDARLRVFVERDENSNVVGKTKKEGFGLGVDDAFGVVAVDEFPSAQAALAPFGEGKRRLPYLLERDGIGATA